MEAVTGALPSVLAKLAELLKEEYNLQKEAKSGIKYLQTELQSMHGALEDIAKVPAEQLPNNDKIWANDVRELSYDIEDNIDKFMVERKGNKLAKRHGVKKFIDKTLGSLMQRKIRRKFATGIREIKGRVTEVHERRSRYEVKHIVDKPVKVDPRALVRYGKMTDLVGIDEAKEEVIKILIEGNEVSKQPGKVVSIVGFRGLGKTTLANVVYQKLREQFDCSAFVSVSQTPDVDKLFKDMFYQFTKESTASIDVVDELRELLQEKRYLIILDDIWYISHWDQLRCALPDVSDGYRIITTTRIFKVAEQIGGAYKMKPLSLENSRILMFRRVFGKEGKHRCPGEELVEVSDRILKKCAGVPLAIITISSLLVSKGINKLEWFDVCNSIGTGLEENSTIEDMRNVLSLSYYDMPFYLRTCLLYLSVFPEDYEIAKDRLIWLWVAEGFIQSRKLNKRLFEMGESCLNELINRSLIQPIYDNYDADIIQSVRVHDMVLDLICSLSSEENFVTIPNDVVHTSTSRMVRRLSLQSGKKEHGRQGAAISMEHVRSVVVFGPAIDRMPALQKFRVLRVLDLEDCDLSGGYSLNYLGNLLHLRYLGLRRTRIDQLPEEVGNLQFLQILDVQGNNIFSLPSTIVQLTHLMCLRLDHKTRVPSGIRSLTCMEELSDLGITNDYTYIINELDHLTELRVLEIISHAEWNEGFDRCLVECLNKLQKIKSLRIWARYSKCILDGWVVTAPQHLCKLWVEGCWFSTLPAWVNRPLLLDLCILRISVRGLQQEELEVLGRLPALRSLYLMVDHQKLGVHGRFTVGACSFPLVGIWRACVVSAWSYAEAHRPCIGFACAEDERTQRRFQFWPGEPAIAAGSQQRGGEGSACCGDARN